MIPHDPFERRLASELAAHRPDPDPDLRARVLRALEREPHPRRGRSDDELVPGPPTERDARTVPRSVAALAAGLLVLVALHASGGDAPEATIAERADAPRAWTEPLEGGAAGLEAQLLAQGGLFAEDARRVAESFLERMPSAPWRPRTDAGSPGDEGR